MEADSEANPPKPSEKEVAVAAVPEPRSKRARKSAQAYNPGNFAAEKKTVEAYLLQYGRGTKLGDMPSVRESIDEYSNTSETIVMAHRFLFGGLSSKNRKKDLFDFRGYLPPKVDGEEKDEREAKDEAAEKKMSIKAYKLNVADLKILCDLFDVDRGFTKGKDDLIDRLLDFLGAPAVKLTKKGSQQSKKRASKKKEPKQKEESEEEEKDEEEPMGEDGMPTDKTLRKWVRAYIGCFNLDKATTKHALETASDKFGVDLSSKKARLKELLTEEM